MLGRTIALLGVAGLLGLGLTSGGAQEKEALPDYPAVGSLIPGPLSKVINVTGERKGRYHCLVVRNGLHPVAAVFVRLRDKDASIEDGLKKIADDQPLLKLFKKLDTLVDQNLDTYCATYAVFEVEPDEKKAEEFQTARRLEDIEKSLELKRLVFGVAEGLPKDADAKARAARHMPPDLEVFVVLYRYHKVARTFAFTSDKPLTDKDVDEIAAAYVQMIPKLPKRVIKIVD